MAKHEAIYRSADMTYIQLYIPQEIVREVVCLLGKLGNVMFRDLNSDLSAFQRGYVARLRRLEDVGRSVDYMKRVSEKHREATARYMPQLFEDEELDDLEFNATNDNPGSNTGDDNESLLSQQNLDNLVRPSRRVNPHALFPQLLRSLEVHSMDTINDIIHEITEFESRVKQLDDSLESLRDKLNVLIEKRHIVFECSRYIKFNPGILGRISNSNDANVSGSQLDVTDFTALPEEANDNLSDFSFDIDEDTAEDNQNNNNDDDILMLEQGFHNKFMIAGAIRRDKVMILNRILWRLLRGNLFFQNFPVEKPMMENGELVEKDCFLIFTHGDTLSAKIKRLVDSLGGSMISLDQISQQTIQELNDRISDLEQVLESTERTLHTELLLINDQLPVWHAVFRRETYIYATLNLFRQETQGLVAEGWIPYEELQTLKNTLKDYSESIGSEYTTVISVIITNRSPPTYHRVNKFTQAFQSIVDAYGIATYKEINPGLATVVTFPFMFAIMFGDAGHGFIVLLIALYLVMNERKFDNMKREEMFDMAYTGRYVLLLMGAFSIYTGLMYNDIFSRSMTLFSSGWEWPTTFKKGETLEAKQVGTYAFGLDWAWHGTENNLIFTNSYKMKLSILMGFIHMSYSYMFSYINYRHRKSRVDIIGNFIPGLIFMQSIFGYLSWAIVFKWSKDWIKDGKPAPGLLNMLINMFLAPGTIDEQLYSGQAVLQTILLLAALVCVPWLLLYKPLMLRKQHANGETNYSSLQHPTADDTMTSESIIDNEVVITDFDTDESESHGFNFGDVMIHQVIHTIEFCLNCISHTASYLRLWALSLAHAQLSTVLWNMTIANSFSSKDPGSPLAVFMVVFLFAFWFILTVAVLVLMEGTSAMLHALRLHWVEAMSKFFEGNGYAYEPFSFDLLTE